MLFTLTQAGKLYGKPRSTFHRAIESGRLSCTIEADGSRRVDFAELIRVYGEPPATQHETQHTVAPMPADDATRNAELVEVMRALLEENRAMRAELQGMRSELTAIREQQRLLPAPDHDQRADNARRAVSHAEPEPDAEDPHGLRALAGSLRQ